MSAPSLWVSVVGSGLLLNFPEQKPASQGQGLEPSTGRSTLVCGPGVTQDLPVLRLFLQEAGPPLRQGGCQDHGRVTGLQVWPRPRGQTQLQSLDFSLYNPGPLTVEVSAGLLRSGLGGQKCTHPQPLPSPAAMLMCLGASAPGSGYPSSVFTLWSVPRSPPAPERIWPPLTTHVSDNLSKLSA